MNTLLKSERACVNPRRRLLASGNSVTHILGGNLPRSTFTIHRGKQNEELTIDQARFCLEVSATLTSDGRTIAAAESCTCGQVVAQLGAIAGASAVLRESLVAYHEGVM